jgi:hypothetical protein
MKKNSKVFGFLPRKVAITILVSGFGVAGFYIADAFNWLPGVIFFLAIALIAMGVGTYFVVDDIIN